MAKKKLTGPKVAPIKLNGTEVFEHGEDDYSAMHLENSIYPTNLTPKGVKYAEEVGEHAVKAGKKNIISSTVQRAEQTADVISSMGKRLQHYDNPVLNTWNIGVYNGTPEGSFNEVEWARNPNAAPEGGESFNDFASRMQDAYKFAKDAPKDDQLIAHSKVTRALEALNSTKGKWTPKTTEKFLDAKEENKANNGGWLDKYNDGGPVQENYNDYSMSAPEGFVGSGTFNKGRDYSPAWGGQFADGGPVKRFMQPDDSQLRIGWNPEAKGFSTEYSTSVGGPGEVYLVPGFKQGQLLKDPELEFINTGEHLGGPFKSIESAEDFAKLRHQYVEKGQKIPAPFKTRDYAMGGSLPGAVGFMYARTAGAAPSNGPYAKKTKASAENGTEMRFYQEGLDFKPKTISKDGSQLVKLDQLTNFTNYNTKQPGGWLDKYEG